jgi:hypothetical protein
MAAQAADLVTAPVPEPPVGAAAAVGAIHFAALEHDFGRIPVGAVVKTEFVFTNTGSATLQVTDVRPGCGCTTAGTWDRSVEPGGTGRIPVQFNSMNFNGRINKAVTVTTSDPAQRTLALRILAEVWRPVELSPNFVYFNSVDPDVQETRVARLTNNTPELLKVYDLYQTNSMFRVELREVEVGKVFEFLISTVPPLEGGNPQTLITAKTSSTNMPEVRLTAMATVYPPVTVTPGTLMLPAGPLTGSTRYVISIRNHRPSLPMAIAEVKCNLPDVTLTPAAPDASGVWTFGAVFPQGYLLKPGEMGQISITTTHPKLQQLSVNVVQMTSTTRPASGALFPPVPGGKKVDFPSAAAANSLTGPNFSSGGPAR